MPDQSQRETRTTSARPLGDGRTSGHRPASLEALGNLGLRTVVVVLIALLLAGVTYLLWSSIQVLLQAFAGVLLAVLLCTLARWLQQRSGMSYGWSLTAVVVALVLLTGGGGWLLANRIASQFGELTQQLPRSFEQIRNYLEEIPSGRLLLEHVPQAANSVTDVGEFSRLTGLISGVANFAITAVVILVVGIFGAAEPQVYREGFLHLVPPPYRRRTAEAVDVLVFNIRWWLVGQVVLMIIMGATTTLGLWLLGIPLALTLGLIAGILELVPYVGPWLSVVPAALIALLVSPWHLAMVLVLYLFLHILEGYVLLPLIQRQALALPPALTVVMQVLLGELLGVLGLFVAAPLTVAGVVLLKMLYVEDTLGDEAVEVPGEPDH